MDKKQLFKWILLAGLTTWSIAVVTPWNKKITYGIDLKGGTRYALQVDTAGLADAVKSDAASRALEVIRNRVDEMGVAEPVIYSAPDNRIIVELPGLEPAQRERARGNLQRAAFLEFRMVHDKNEKMIDDLFAKGLAPEGYQIVSVTSKRNNGLWDYEKYYAPVENVEAAGTNAPSREVLRQRARKFQAPPGHEMLFLRERRGLQELYRPFYVETRTQLTGDTLNNARVDYDQMNLPRVSLKFDGVGKKKFATCTKDYAPGGDKNPNPQNYRLLAIVLDGTVYSAPRLIEPIFGGEAVITGNFDQKEAQDLAIVLRAGALPAPIRILEERTVAPTLGEDSIASGKWAAIVGALGVAAFMILYYFRAGLIANAALMMNLVLMPIGILAMSALFGLLTGTISGEMTLPTLTLPGIAGIALTIGMAVDANVLIYERMREEQKAGKRLRAVVPAGYEKAFSAIFDSNITTLIAAGILFWQGTGPVRGYAVTLSGGILISMYTALVVTRMIFDLWAARNPTGEIKMLQLFKPTSIDFVGARKICVGISLVVIGATAVLFALRGEKNFGVDFTGGASVAFSYTNRVPVAEVRDALAKAGVSDAVIQYQSGLGGGGDRLEIKVPFAHGTNASAIVAALPAGGFEVQQEDQVGPQIGAELQRQAIIAVLLSLVGIIIYVSIRFEFPFAAGAVVALFHDVLIGVGVFCALGGQLSVTMIAALLTIIGYSVNDTIVIFDRIRELLKLNPSAKLGDVANLAINQTLSRTILTSFATMLSVIALLVIGGGSIADFSLLLLIGMISGVYSTVYIATPVAMLWHRGPKPAAPAKAKTA